MRTPAHLRTLTVFAALFLVAASARADDANAAAPALTAGSAEPDTTVTVRPGAASTRRGAGDVTVRRDLLEASPRARASELLSAAPGMFVDHEDGEGLGNDVHLRGFDFEHGSGIELRIGGVAINSPTHLLGQGYADIDFILPEVVRSLRVQEGIYDPRQGDAAVAGTVDLDLGVAERGYLLRTSYGSFRQLRTAFVIAPRDAEPETFLAGALRRSDGFGPSNRASSSASLNASHAFEVGDRTRVRLLATAYGARADLAGVLRADDLEAGRIGWLDSYASPYARGQSVASSRFFALATVDHLALSGERLEVTLWSTRTALALRQNYTGNIDASLASPSIVGRGDLVESENRELAYGALARLQSGSIRLAPAVELRVEPGLSLRSSATRQSRSLLAASDLTPWDRRVDADVGATDIGTYLDLDTRLFERLRIAGGLRADVLAVSVDDHLAPGGSDGGSPHRRALGVALSPKVVASVEALPWLTPSVSYGEGFRSLDPRHLADGETRPYAKVRSGEVGARARLAGDRYVATLAFFETHVENELVFEASSGALEAQGASVRRGLVAAIVARPIASVLSSFALTVNRAIYDVPNDDGNRYVPGVPGFLFRSDVALRGALFALAGRDVLGRAGIGWTVLGARHLTDRIVTAPRSVLNLGGALRYGAVELGVDVFNALDLRYADDEAVFVSSWTTGGNGPPPVTPTRHISAAPPRTTMGTLTLAM